MKVTVQFDTAVPQQAALLAKLLAAQSDGVTVASQPVAPPYVSVTPGPVGPQLGTDVVSQPVTHETNVVTTTATPSATPLTDLRQQLTALFNRIYAVDPAAAMSAAELCRTEFGADNKSWTQEQWQTALTRLQAVDRS